MEEIEQQDGALENTDDAQSDDKQETAKAEPDYKAEAAKWKRIAERNAKKADKSDDAPKSEPSKEPSDLDYGQKALLRSMGIKGADELQLAKDFLKRTGQDIDSLETDDIFQGKLDKLRTTKANELATSAEGNRGRSGGGKDTPEYWLAKLGPTDDVPSDLPRELREKIVEARVGKGKDSKMFYNS